MNFKNTRLVLMLALITLTQSLSAQKPSTAPVPPNLPVNKETKLFTWEGVTEITGVNKDGLYERAMAWAQSYYKNPADVIREKDPASGKIVCKARFKIYNPEDKKGVTSDAGDVMYTLTLQFKDGRYKFELTKCTWMLASSYPCERWTDTSSAYHKKEYEHYLTQLDSKATEVLQSLKRAMTATPAKKKDDW